MIVSEILLLELSKVTPCPFTFGGMGVSRKSSEALVEALGERYLKVSGYYSVKEDYGDRPSSCRRTSEYVTSHVRPGVWELGW